MKVKGYSVYQRESDKRWIGAIELEKEPGQTRNRKTVSAKTEKEAKQKLNKLLYEIENGEYTKPNKDTLIGFLKEYHKICAGYDMWDADAIPPEKPTWEQTTASLYKMYIDVHFEPYFKDIKLVDIKALTLDKYYIYKMTNTREYKVRKKDVLVTKIAQPLGINTVIKLHKFLKAAFHYALDNDLIKKNPTDGVKLASKEDYTPNVYNETQFLQLLNYVKNSDDEIYVVLGAGCGLRRGEICGLRWKNIDFNNKTITIEKTEVRFDKTMEKKPKTKTSKRIIKAPDYVIDTLDKYNKKLEVLNSDNKIITRWKPQSVSERFSNLLDKFDMEHIRLHDLRHYNAIIMMNYGIPDKVAAERLGHSNVSTLRNVYQHVLKEIDEKAANEINDMFNNKK